MTQTGPDLGGAQLTTMDGEGRHWRGGFYFDGLTPGVTYRHRLTRTVTQMDNMLFSNMTMNPQPLHVDRHFCENDTQWGQPLMNSLFTLGLMIGMTVNDTTLGTTVANLGMSDVRFPKPIFHGDTIRVVTTVKDKRDSSSRPRQGIVTFLHEAYNQSNECVAICERAALMHRKPN